MKRNADEWVKSLEKEGRGEENVNDLRGIDEPSFSVISKTPSHQVVDD